MSIALIGCIPQDSSETSTKFKASPKSKQSPKQESILGVWRVVGIGEKKLEDHGIVILWTFGKEELVVSNEVGHQLSRSGFQTDLLKSPHHITLVIGDDPRETRPGIFEFDGDRLRISMNVDGGTRPNSFSEGEFLILERVLGPDL